MSRSSSAVSTSPSDLVLLVLSGCGQAVLGLILGVATSFVLHGVDPFGVVAFTVPQDVDFAQQNAAYDQWKSSGRVIIGSLAMDLAPLLVSGLCGVFAYGSLPSFPAAVRRMAGVALLLLLVSQIGSRAIDRALSTGESSDIQTPLAILAFKALCIALAAPLTSSVTRRRAD